jgi:hypothetical protein
MTTDQMTQREIRQFGDKLEAFRSELSPKEQAFLGEILTRAASAEPDEVTGYKGAHLDIVQVNIPATLEDIANKIERWN